MPLLRKCKSLGGDAISRKALIERINQAEENFKADHIESISSGDDPFVDGVLSGVFNIRQMVAQAPPIEKSEVQDTESQIKEAFKQVEGYLTECLPIGCPRDKTESEG